MSNSSKHDLNIPAGRPTGPILVVADHDPGVLVQRLLTDAGHETLRASDVDEAIELLDSSRPACSCVIADRDGRIADGVMSLLDRTRAFGPVSLAEVPFVVMGTQTTKQFLLWQSGVDGYIQRPIHSRDLLEAIHAVLTRTDEERARLRREMIDELSRVSF
ncbi:MAG: hypothetical protein ACR2QE_19775 [Acidimicrobiales bacterium]